jgi:TrmH family RNA methyltransferase
MTSPRITSAQNPRIKLANKLHDKRQRVREGLFVVDSGRDLIRALDAGYELDYALYAPDRDAYAEASLEQLNQLGAKHLFEVDKSILAKASYRQNPAGIVAVLHQKPILPVTALPTDAKQILCLVDLRKPGNIGALLRTADGAGFDAVLLVDTTLDIYNPNIIRSSTGACFLGNIYEGDSHDTIKVLKARGYRTISTHLGGEASVFEINFTEPFALVLGTEADGLPDLWVKASNHLAIIPMLGQLADSFNVSVAGAIFMYEAMRQRQSSLQA